MSSAYAGNPVYPASVTLPDDGEPSHAVAVNVSFKALGDRTAYLKQTQAAVAGAATTFTSSGTWVCPAGVSRIVLEACGGGGGGGGGANGGTTSLYYSMGGGGGGAARRALFVIDVTPGITYEIIIGSGGTAGLGGATNTDGGDGGDTIFRVQGGAELARWRGARGGRKGSQIVNTIGAPVSYVGLVPGGTPVRTMRTPAVRNFESSATTPENETLVYGPGFGGEGVTSQFTTDTRDGADSVEGRAGGAAGAQGTNPGGGAYPPGGSGGGGAASGYAPGYGGLDGGAGSTGTGGNAQVGVGTPSSGAGGGGGGGGGSGPTAGGLGTGGYPGGAGRLILQPRG